MPRAAQTLLTVIPLAARPRCAGELSTATGDCGRVCASCEGYMIREKMGALVGWPMLLGWRPGDGGELGSAS